MNYQINTGAKVSEFVESLDKAKRARVDRLYDLFELYGRYLPSKYLKKIAKEVWELRPGDVRLFMTIRGNTGFVVHGIFKKTQKTPKRDLDLAIKRIKELIK